MPTIIKVTPITRRIMSIIRPKQPSVISCFATEQKPIPIIISTIPKGAPKIMLHAVITIIANNSLIKRNKLCYTIFNTI